MASKFDMWMKKRYEDDKKKTLEREGESGMTGTWTKKKYLAATQNFAKKKKK